MTFSWHLHLCAGLGTALIMMLATHLAMIPWRRSAGAHWAERARLLWPARKVRAAVIFTCIICAGLLAWMQGQAERAAELYPAVFAGFFGGSFVSTREIEPRYRFAVWLNETFWQVLVQFGAVAIFIGLMITMPPVMQPRDWLHFAAGTCAVFVIITGLWLPLLRVLRRPKTSPDGRLERLVDEMAAQAGIRPRWIFYGESPLALAAALTYLRSLAFTSRVVEITTDDELRGIILHELAHLREGMAVQLTRLAPSLALMLLTLIRPAMHQFGPPGFFGLLAAVFLLLKLGTRTARRMEHHADDAAVRGSADPACYARALEKLYQANQIPAVMRGSSKVHPHLYDRMLAAGVTPDYPRPAPPALLAWPGWVVLIGLPLALLAWRLWPA